MNLRPPHTTLGPVTALVAVTALLVAMPARAQDTAAVIDSIFGFATSETPGCAIGVSQNGTVVVTRAYGLADVDRRLPLSPATLFDIGSVQKQFVAAAVLLLVEDGRLSLSDDIRRYFPELPDYGHAITVNHLLTHTSGIRDWTGLLPLADEGSDVLQLILRQRGLNFTPGAEWSYSNSGYVLLKEIVARASGLSFADFARTRLFAPLGMKSSAYVADILQGTGERALAYQKEGDGWKQHMRLGNERGGGAVISNASELLIWNDALTSGRLGPFVTAKLQEPTTLDNGRKLSYARGLILQNEPEGPMVWHSGGAAGYGTVVVRMLDQGLSIAALCNFEPVSVSSLAGRVADLFLPAVEPQAQRTGPVAAPGVDVAGRAGLYLAERSGEPLRLAVNNGRLTIATGPALVPVSAERFLPQRTSLYYRSEDEFELTFRSDDELELTSMEGQTTRYRRAQPWTPAAADLQAVDGRYHNEELGTVFEILPGTNGLVWRFEGAPEKAIELEPVARDTYMRSMQIVRFRRDASGRVTGLDYTNPVLRNMALTRLGDRAASAPTGPATADQAAATPAAPAVPAAPGTPAAPAPQLERVVGEYEMAPGRTLTITLEDGRLHGQPTGNAKAPLMHVAGATFAVGRADGPIRVTFMLGEDGRATALVMRQNGNERTLPRVR